MLKLILKKIKETHRYQRTLTKRVDPVLVPQHREDVIVKTGFEDLNIQLVVLISVYSKVLDLVERYRLVFRARCVGRRVVFRVSTESSDVDFASRDGTVGIDLTQRIHDVIKGGGELKRTTTATKGS